MSTELIPRSSYLDGTPDTRLIVCCFCEQSFKWWNIVVPVYTREPHNNETLLFGKAHLLCKLKRR